MGRGSVVRRATAVENPESMELPTADVSPVARGDLNLGPMAALSKFPAKSTSPTSSIRRLAGRESSMSMVLIVCAARAALGVIGKEVMRPPLVQDGAGSAFHIDCAIC